MTSAPQAEETKPVLANDGSTILGFCEVRKYRRNAGTPRREIVIRNAEKTKLATILVYRLHSRVQCGPLEIEGVLIDSKHALEIARVALENGDSREALVAAIQSESARLQSPS